MSEFEDYLQNEDRSINTIRSYNDTLFKFQKWLYYEIDSVIKKQEYFTPKIFKHMSY